MYVRGGTLPHSSPFHKWGFTSTALGKREHSRRHVLGRSVFPRGRGATILVVTESEPAIRQLVPISQWGHVKIKDSSHLCSCSLGLSELNGV